MDRRLTTIVAAEVVGYSRLMDADEAGTLAALKDRRAGVGDGAQRQGAGARPNHAHTKRLRDPARNAENV